MPVSRFFSPGGQGGGFENRLAYSCHRESIQTQAQGNFFLLYGTPKQWRVLRARMNPWGAM